MKRHIPRAVVLTALVLAAALIPVQAQFGQNKIAYEHFDWQVYRSPHFDIHYYPAMEPFLEELVSYAESAYVQLSRELDHELRFRVPLVCYKTHGEFQQTNIILSEISEGVGAFAEPAQNRMVLPIDLPPDKLYQLIAHELTHIFQYSMFFDGYLGRALRSNPPLWLMEGLASYLADDEDPLDLMVIRDAVVNNILPPIQALNQLSFLTYRYGHAIFDYIEQEYGKEGLRSFLFEYRKVLLTNNLEKAIQESFGHDIDTFNRLFSRYLRKKYFPVLMEKKSPDEFGVEVGVKKRGVFTLSPNISPSGELMAVLASPRQELDLMILSADDGEKIKNLTKGYTNKYRYLVTEAFSGKRDLSWAPNADEVAVFARREDKWPLFVFDALSGKRRHKITFDDIVECASPTFSPDGRRIAFEGNRNGVVDIFEVDLESREVRNLTQDDSFDANPWYAADGESLLYNRRIGAHWKIFSVGLDDADIKTQLTFGPSIDLQPSLSRDGSAIYFSSDRGPNGVFNIYAMDLATGDLEQYTDVVGGCFAPVEVAERDGERNLVFAAFFEGTFRLYRMPLGESERAIPAETAAVVYEDELFEPPLNLTVDEPQKSPYKARWDVEAPFVSVGVTDDGTFLADAAVQFSDLMGNQRIQIIASTVAEYSNYTAVYYNLRRRFNWGAAAFDNRDFFLRAEANGNVERDQLNRTTGAQAFIQYPFSRHYRVDASIGLQENSDDLFLGTDPVTGRLLFQNFSDIYMPVSLSLTGDTTRFQSFGPFQGKRFKVGTTYAPHLSGDSDGEFIQHTADFRAYRRVTRRSVLAFRFASIYNDGDRQTNYGLGGVNQLRGYEYREFVGSRLAWANLEFRFPLVEEVRFPILSLFQIRGVLFLDAGAAWFQDNDWYDPVLGVVRDDETGTGFSFWDSDRNQLQDGRASYGFGLQFVFLGGLQFNWNWAHRLDYTQFDLLGNPHDADTGGTRTDFYIAFDF